MTQPEIEDLSAYLDGELEAGRASEVAELVATDAAWASACAQMQAVTAAMDSTPAPLLPADFADRIVAGVHARQRRGVVLTLVRYAAPLAAAAAVVVAVVLWHNKPEPTAPNNSTVATALVDDEVVVENLDFFKDFQVVDNYQTLQAIDDLEKASLGGEETPQGI